MTVAAVRSPFARMESGLLVLLAVSGMISVAVSQSLMAVLALLLAGRSLLKRPRARPAGFEWSVGLYVLWCLLMIPFSTDPGFSLLMAKRFGIYSILWVGALMVDGDDRRRALLWALVLGAVVNAGWSLATEDYGWALKSRRLTLIQGSAMTGAWLMAAASILMMAFTTALPGKRAKLLLLLAQAPVLAAVFFTRTRSAWLGLLAGWLVILLLRRKRLLPLLAAALALAVVFAPADVKDRIRSIGDPAQSSNSERLTQWRHGLELVRWKPVTGVGDVYLRDVLAERTTYENKHDDDMHHLHHSYLTAAVFWGIPGAALLVLMLGHLLWRLGKAWRGRDGLTPLQRGWVLAGLGVWTLYALVGVIDSTVIDPETSLICLFVLGVGSGPGRRHLRS